MGQLCDISDVEKYLLTSYPDNPSIIDETDQVEYLIDSVSSEIERICNRKFNQADYDEIYDIDGSKIFLNQYPILGIDLVEYGSPGIYSRTALLSTDYWSISDSGIVSLNFSVRRAEQYVHVQYSAGYLEIPEDLNLLCVKEVVRSLNGTMINTNIKSEKLGQRSYTYNSDVENKNNLQDNLVKYIKSNI